MNVDWSSDIEAGTVNKEIGEHTGKSYSIVTVENSNDNV